MRPIGDDGIFRAPHHIGPIEEYEHIANSIQAYCSDILKQFPKRISIKHPYNSDYDMILTNIKINYSQYNNLDYPTNQAIVHYTVTYPNLPRSYGSSSQLENPKEETMGWNYFFENILPPHLQRKYIELCNKRIYRYHDSRPMNRYLAHLMDEALNTRTTDFRRPRNSVINYINPSELNNPGTSILGMLGRQRTRKQKAISNHRRKKRRL